MKGSETVLTTVVAALLLATAVPIAAQTTPPYQGGEVEGGGMIVGRVTWSGPRPELEPLAINKNPEVCDVDGNRQRPSERLLISGSGGVANAVVHLEEIQQGKPLPTAGARLDQRNCRYDPHIVILPRKAELTMSSGDKILHNIHMFDAANYNIPFPNMDSVTKKMRKAGVVSVQCDAGHGWMSAYIHVVNHPYYVVTDAEGNFKLTDVPPGKYTLKMWHESWVVTEEVKKDDAVVGYEFGEPIERSREVEIAASAEAQVDFVLSGQAAEGQ